MATLSIDLRERIVAAYDADEGTRQQIAERFCVSLGMVKKLLQQRRNTGDISPRHHHSGRKSKVTPTHRRQLERLVDARPDMTLEELRDAVGVDCSLPALHNALKKIGLSYKKRRSKLPSRNASISGKNAIAGTRP
jgi:transposase